MKLCLLKLSRIFYTKTQLNKRWQHMPYASCLQLLNSQPPPQMSPMDFSYEFLMLQRGNHVTTKKLEYYEDFIMILLGELKTLRETMCSCQQKCTSSKTTRSADQSLAAPNDSMGPRRPHVEDDVPTLLQMPKMNVSRLTTPSPGSSYIPVNTAVASVASPHVEIPTEWNTLGNESNNYMFYAVRDSSADTTLDVTFVHSFRHKMSVYCVSFRRDGRYMAVGTGNSSIFIYEVESRKKYCELREYASQYGSYARPAPWNLCFSSDGRYLAVVDNARIIIWDVQKKRIRSSIFHESCLAPEVRFSPDGRLVAFCSDLKLLVLNVRDNSRRMASEGSCFDFSPHGRYIATGNDDVLAILNVRTGKAVKRWNGHGRYHYSMKYTSDGRGLLCSWGEMIEQWDVSDAVPVLIREFSIRNKFYRVISPDHRLLGNLNELWDVNSGKRQYTLEGHEDSCYVLDISPAGAYLALGALDGFVSLWKYTYT